MDMVKGKLYLLRTVKARDVPRNETDYESSENTLTRFELLYLAVKRTQVC